MDRENGIVIGVVDDLDDKESLGRVRVKFPHLGDQLSDWARIASPLAGNKFGMVLRPERGDEVLVVLEHGSPTRPLIIGGLYSKKNPLPKDDGKRVQNNWRFFQSRSGHVLLFDDTAGAEFVKIVGKGGKQSIVIDVAKAKIQITCSTGDIELSAPSGTLKVDANAVEIAAKTTLKMTANGALTIKGQTVSIN